MIFWGFAHYFLHFLLPPIICCVLKIKDWKKVSLFLVGANLIDLDHLLAEPIFQADRCSINFHPLHTHYALVLYCLMALTPKLSLRFLGIGCLWHLMVDGLDCLVM